MIRTYKTILFLVVQLIISIQLTAQQFDLISQEGHRKEIDFLDFSPSGKYLATQGKDGFVFIWDIQKQLKIYQRHYNKSITGLNFSVDGNYVLINTGYVVEKWDFKTDSISELDISDKYSFSDDLKYIVGTYSANFYVRRTNDPNSTLIYHEEKRQNNDAELTIRAIGVNHKFTKVVTLRQKEINIWDISGVDLNGQKEYLEPTLQKTIKIDKINDDRTLKIISNDSVITIVHFENYSTDNKIHIYKIDLLTLEMVEETIELTVPITSLNRYEMSSIDVTRDLKKIAATVWDDSKMDRITFVWNLNSKELLYAIPELGPKCKLHPTEDKIVFSDKGFEIYDLNRKSVYMNIQPFDKDYGINKLLVSDDLNFLISNTTYSGIDIWDLSSMQLIHNIPNRSDGDILKNSTIRLSHDGNILAFARGSSIAFYDLKNRREIESLAINNGMSTYINAFDFSTDDKYIYTFGNRMRENDLVVKRWDLSKENEWTTDDKGKVTNNREELVYFSKLAFDRKDYSVKYLADFSDNGNSLVIGRTGIDKNNKTAKGEIEFISLGEKVAGEKIPSNKDIHFLEALYIQRSDSLIHINQGMEFEVDLNYQFDLRSKQWIKSGKINFNGGELTNDHFYGNSWQDSLYKIDIIHHTSENLGIKTNDVLVVDKSERYLFSVGEDNAINITSLENLKQLAKIFIMDSNTYFTLCPDNYYKSSKNGVSKMALRANNDIYTIEQFDLIYNRPDIVMERLGFNDPKMNDAYRNAYLKRLKKKGFNDDILQIELNLPTLTLLNKNEILSNTEEDHIAMEIKMFDAKNNLNSYNVWINGTPIYGVKGIDIKSFGQKQHQTIVNLELLEGINKIKFSCINSKGIESFYESIVVNYIPTILQKQTTYFIGIGIDHFSQPSHNLAYSVKDIRDLANGLKVKLGKQLIIDTLFNENVLVENIEKLKQRLLNSSINDKIIVAYSGHGLLSKEFDYFLSSYNVNFQQPENGGIPYELLADLLDSIPARKKLMLIDACHSGEVDKDELIATNESSKEGEKDGKYKVKMRLGNVGLKNSFQLMQELFVDVEKGSGATVISAAGGDQSALEDGVLKNGYFTYAILQLLNSKESVTVNELKAHVLKEVLILSKGKQKPTSRVENLEVDWKVW